VRSNDFRICRGYRAKQQKRENETNSNARTGFHIQLISVIYDNYILSSPYSALTADPRHEFLRANFMPVGEKGWYERREGPALRRRISESKRHHR
jgi:hypothetical protein